VAGFFNTIDPKEDIHGAQVTLGSQLTNFSTYVELLCDEVPKAISPDNCCP